MLHARAGLGDDAAVLLWRRQAWALTDGTDWSRYDDHQLLESRLEFLCPYSGKQVRELEVVAPHIVELLPQHRFTKHLLRG